MAQAWPRFLSIPERTTRGCCGSGSDRGARRRTVLPGLRRRTGRAEAGNGIGSGADIFAQPLPEVRRYAVDVQGLQDCMRIRGQHPDIALGQQGANCLSSGAARQGDGTRSALPAWCAGAQDARHHEELTGVRLTQGAITQDAMKQGERASYYDALRALVSRQPVVHTDDTGWRVAGKTAFLMAFVNQSLSVYQVRPQHRNEEVRELVPGDFGVPRSVTGVGVTMRRN